MPLALPPVPPQLANEHASWATELYRYLKLLWAALVTIITNNGNVITYQQGGVANPSEGIYVTWATAYAAANAIRWLLPTIIVDNSFAEGEITAGSWNLNYILLKGAIIIGQSNSGFLKVDDGALITGQHYSADAVHLYSVATTAPPCTVFASHMIFSLTNGASLNTDPSSTQVFCAVVTGSASISLSGGAAVNNFAGGAGTAVFSVNEGGSLGVIASEESAISANTLAGGGATTVQVCDQSVSYSQTQFNAGIVWLIGGGTATTRVQAVNTSAQTIHSGAAPATQTITNYTAVTNQSPSLGGLNAVTGFYTAPVTDFYTINASIEFAAMSGGAAGSEFTLAIFHTPISTGIDAIIAEDAYENPVVSLIQKRQLQVSISLLLNAGDTIDIRASQASGADIILTASPSRNYLSIATAA